LVVARLMVSRPSPDDPGSDDWGLLEFVALPRPDDCVALHRGLDILYLRVESVRHFPCPAEGDIPSGSARTPSAFVFVNWPGVD
jgi:hypothetical protein